MKSLALFDFDGTLTCKDSLVDFILYTKGKLHTVVGGLYLFPVLAGFSLRSIDNSTAKEKVLKHFFQHYDFNKLTRIGNIYALKRLPNILRPKAVKRLSWHLSEKHDVCVVSASPEIWINAWTNHVGIHLIGTRLENKNGKFTGRFEGKNCQGKEKVQRILKIYDLEIYDRIYAYGDSPADKPMLDLADEPFYKPFRYSNKYPR